MKNVKGIFKNLCMLMICIMMICFQSGCFLFDQSHISDDMAKDIAEELIDESVELIDTVELEDKEEIVYVFKDSRGNEFAIISLLSRPQFEALEYGSYECTVMDSYVVGAFLSNIDKIMDILKEYELEEYLGINGRLLGTDIYAGEGVNSPDFELMRNSGTIEENLEFLKTVSEAVAKIDELLSLNYHGWEWEKDRSDDYKYYVGLEFGFELNIEKTYESGYSTCDIASIAWSVSDETRWTKENVFEYLKNELTWSVNEVDE